MYNSINTGDNNSGNRNTGDWNTGVWNIGDNNTGYWNTGDNNTGYWNSGDNNTGYWNSGNLNTGYKNTGYGNSANRQSGIFNSSEGTVRIFNKDSGKTWDEIDHPHFRGFFLCKWVAWSDMTAYEKKEKPKAEKAEGYFKQYTYKEAWDNFWRDTDEANRQKFLNLPNFDAEIFKEITGVDVTAHVHKKN